MHRYQLVSARAFKLAAILLCIAWSAAPAEWDASEQAIIDWVDAHAEESIALLETTVNINSGTLNKPGVRRVGEVLAAEYALLGFETHWVDVPEVMDRAGHLVARSQGQKGKKILLIGHLDTVFEPDDAFQKFERDGDRATGPGIGDMKAGNVVMLYALKALLSAGALDDIQVAAIYTGDEESPGLPLEQARFDLVELGKWAEVALGFEGASYHDGADWATIARRSSHEWRLTVDGQQAHSSGIFSEATGAGAIFEAARILSEFYDSVRGEDYLTFNAGTILGGTDVSYDFDETRGSAFGKTNVVPRKVIVHGGIRTVSPEQYERARKAMTAVVAKHLPQTNAHLEFIDGYPAMAPTEGNRALQRELSAINEALGRGPMEALDPSRRGAADISFVGPYVDGLAGMGAIGSGAHTPEESLDLRSMPLAIKRAALLIYRISR
jgi:glutamate carboxypeptidase